MVKVEELENRLDKELRGRRAGQTQIEQVRVREAEDSQGEPAILVAVTLSNPPDGLETWPVEDVWNLRRQVSDVAQGVEEMLERPWYITFEPKDAGELAPEDTSEQVTV